MKPRLLFQKNQILSLQTAHIEVTKANYDLVKECHYMKDYYKIGDKIGVPDVAFENSGYETIKNALENVIEIYNAGINSRLSNFPKVNFNSLFE